MADWSDLVGLSLEAAQKRAEKYGHIVRAMRYNDQPAIVTADYKTDRIGVCVEREPEAIDAPWIVTKVWGIG